MKSSDKFLNGWIYLCVFSIPFQLGTYFWLPELLMKGLRVDYLSIHIVVADLLLLGLLLLLVIQKKIIVQRLPLSLVALVGWILLQSLWAVHPWLQGYMAIKIVLWLTLAYSLTCLSVSVRWISWLLVSQVLILAFLASLQWWQQHSLQGIWYWLGERSFSPTTPNIALQSWDGQLWLRPYATFSHPNVLAGYVGLIMIFLFDYWLRSRRSLSKLENWLLIFSLFVGSWLLLISFSQAVWIMIGIAIVLFQLSRFLTGTWLDFRLWGVICMIMPWMLLELGNYIQAESLVLRNQLFQHWLVNQTFGEVLLGTGWMGALVSMGDLRQIVVTRALVQPIHHTWFLWISSLGLGATCFLAWGLSRYLKPLFRQPRYAIWFICLFWLGSLDHYLFTQPQTWYLTAVIIGLMYRSANTPS